MKNTDPTHETPDAASGSLSKNPWELGTTEVTIAKTIRRFSFKTLFTDVLDAFMFNKGLLFTIKQLFVAPGVSLRGYLGTERFRLMGPVRFFIVMTGVQVFLYFKLGIIDEMKAASAKVASISGGGEDIDVSFMDFIYDYLSLMSAGAALFYSIYGTMLFKVGYNYVEHLIINLFIEGQACLLYIINAILFYFTGDFTIFNILNGILFIILLLFVYKKTFRQSIGKTIIKTIGIYLLGYISFILIVGIVGAIYGIFLALSGQIF